MSETLEYSLNTQYISVLCLYFGHLQYLHVGNMLNNFVVNLVNEM